MHMTENADFTELTPNNNKTWWRQLRNPISRVYILYFFKCLLNNNNNKNTKHTKKQEIMAHTPGGKKAKTPKQSIENEQSLTRQKL